jgi:hypothetical protein
MITGNGSKAPRPALTNPVWLPLDAAPLFNAKSRCRKLAFSVRGVQAQPSATGIWGMSVKISTEE